MSKRRLFGWLLKVVGSLVLLMQAGTAGTADRDTRVAQAARKRDEAAVRALVRQRADVNSSEADGSTALLWASYYSNLGMAQVLIAAGANVTAVNRYGITPLLQACRLGNAPMIGVLLKAGADPAAASPDGETPLMAASESGNADAVRLLLERHVDVNAKEQEQDQTALMWAAGAGHARIVEALLAAGANPNAVARPSSLPRQKGDAGRMWVDHSSGGLTALMFAARQGHVEAARALAETGADLDHANPDGLTAMMIAIINDRIDLAGMLLEHGAAPNDGSLYEAIVMHNLRTNETTGEATRPRMAHANTLTPVDLIARLLDRGADPNRIAGHTLHADGTGQPAPVNESPFVQALRAQDVAALRLLLRKGASANLITEAGFTPLMVAMGAGAGRGGFAGGFGAVPAGFRHPSERSPIEAVKVLLDAGADVNGAARNGDTALHTAAQSGNVAMIQFLADRGVTLDVQNKAGLTPLDLAMGKRAPGADAGRGGRGGGPGRGGAGGGPQPQAVVLLRKLMGLPALPPESLPGPAALTPPVRGDLA